MNSDTTVSEIMKMNNVSPPYPVYVKDLPKNVKTYTDDTDGKWVTINGNHVLIKD